MAGTFDLVKVETFITRYGRQANVMRALTSLGSRDSQGCTTDGRRCRGRSERLGTLLFVRGLHDEIVRLQLGLPVLDACGRQDASSLRTRVGGSFDSVGGRALPPIASLSTDRLRFGSIATGHPARSGTGGRDDLVALRYALGFNPRGELAWRTRRSRPVALLRACGRPSPARRTRRSRGSHTWPPWPSGRRAPSRRACA